MDLHGAFHVYDTTLRDGAQQEGLNLSVADKLTIARQLDGLGVGYIEGGWPGANPKDTEFFRRAAAELDLGTPGSRRSARPARPASARPTTRRSPRCATAAPPSSRWSPSRTTGTSSSPCAPRSRRTSTMIRDTVSHLRAEGQQVFLDAEHFFDGYRAQPRLRPRGAAHGVRRGRRGDRAVRHQRRHAPALGLRRRPRRHRERPACGSASTATTTPAAPSPTRWPPSTPAPRTCRAASTATASAPATPTSSRSWPTSSSSSTARCCRRACCARRPGSRTPSPR